MGTVSRAGQQQDGQGHDFAQTAAKHRHEHGNGCTSLIAVESDTLLEDTLPEESEEHSATQPEWEGVLQLPMQHAGPNEDEPLPVANKRLRISEQAPSGGRLKELAIALEALRQAELGERAEAANFHRCAEEAHAKALEHSESADGLSRRIRDVLDSFGKAELEHGRQRCLEAEEKEARDHNHAAAPPRHAGCGDSDVVMEWATAELPEV